MRRILWYALKGDCLAVTRAVEVQVAMQYVLTNQGLFPEYGATPPKYESASDIPTIGIATRSQTIACERYLAADRLVQLKMGRRMLAGQLVEEFAPGGNRQAIEFCSGGLWCEQILIPGILQAWSDDPLAQSLMRRFMRAIRAAAYCKVGAYWVGPEAYEFLKEGGRLAVNAEAEESFDLRLPD